MAYTGNMTYADDLAVSFTALAGKTWNVFQTTWRDIGFAVLVMYAVCAVLTFILGRTVALLVAGVLLQLAVAGIVRMHRAPADRQVVLALYHAFRQFPGVVLTSLVKYCLIFVWFSLLIIPGITRAASWSFSTWVILDIGTWGRAALDQSSELVRNRRGQVLVYKLLLMVPVLMVTVLALGVIWGIMPHPPINLDFLLPAAKAGQFGESIGTIVNTVSLLMGDEYLLEIIAQLKSASGCLFGLGQIGMFVWQSPSNVLVNFILRVTGAVAVVFWSLFFSVYYQQLDEIGSRVMSREQTEWLLQ